TGTSSTNSITVSYSNNAVSGNISVYGTNSCGNGSSSSLSITVSSSPVNLGTFSGADIAALYNNYSTAGDIQEFLFANTGGQLNLSNITSQYKSETSNFAYSIYDKLTCSGDFDGDGKDEVAIFVKMKYQPNCASGVSCPAYYRTHVVLLKSDGNYFHPIGSWYSDLDTVIDAAKIRFTTSGDFDNDGKSDIAFVYSNGSSASSLMVLKSTGNSFTAPTIFFNALTTSFKMDSVMFALSGDYDGDGKSDMALIYKNNTNKNISVFTSTGTVFNAAQSYYTFPDSLIMTQIKYALSGNFTSDSKSDIALLYKSDFHSSPDSGNVILVLKAMVNSFANPKTYINLTNTISNYSKVLFATTYDFNNDGLSDIALAFDTQTGNPDVQKILLIPSHDTLFATPVSYWNTTTSTFNFTNVKHFVAGKFSYTPAIKACNWQGNKIGALTFSFDDGYDSTIINSKYLYTKGVLGTHNIITHNVGTSNFTSWARMQADTLGNEYGSHTQTHPFLNNIPLTTAATELTGSKQELISHLSTDALSIVLPDGAFNNDVLQSSAMRNNYLSARTSMPGYNLSTPIDQYALYAPVILNATDTSTVFGWVNKTVNYGYWTFLMMHYIGADNGQYSNSFAKFKTIVDYACKQNLWINTQENVMKYITERNALKHVNYSIQNTNTIKLNLDDGLNDIVYNVPLTIKVFIPNTCMKDSVAVTQTGITKYYPVVNENGTLYSYVNCLPNTTDVLITNYRNNITSTRTICQGSSIIVGNHTYSTSGTYLDSLKTSSGCDSIITTILTVNTLPVTAGTITGTTTVNQGQSSLIYIVPAITNATSYVWTLPTGATGTSTTNSITVSYGNTTVSGNITIKGHNTCGDGVSSSLAIIVNVPQVSSFDSLLNIVNTYNQANYTVPSWTLFLKARTALANNKNNTNLANLISVISKMKSSSMPYNIVMNLNKDPKTKMAFDWFTNTGITGEQVQIVQGTASDSTTFNSPLITVNAYCGTANNLRYCLSGNNLSTLAGIADNSTRSYTFNKALVSGLTPNTQYSFRVGKNGAWSDIGSFKTAKDAKDAFSFVYTTDHQATQVDNDFNICQLTTHAAKTMFPQANFWLNCGDIADDAAEWEFEQFFETQQDIFMNNPMVIVQGNHADDSTYHQFTNHFNTDSVTFDYKYPTKAYCPGSTYSFVYGDALFMALNFSDYGVNNDYTHFKKYLDSTAVWMSNQVKAHPEVKWRIAFFHINMYTGAGHYNDFDIDTIQNRMGPVFDSLKIDLALQGHDHIYEVIGPINNRNLVQHPFITNPTSTSISSDNINGKIGGTFNTFEGTLYFLNRNAGNKGYDPATMPSSYSNLFTGRFGQPGLPTYSYVTVATDSINISTYKVNPQGVASLFDAFKIVKTSTISNCVAPLNQPTSLVLTPSATSISGSFTASTGTPSADHYLIIKSTSATLSANPVLGTTYTTGQTFGGGTIINYQTTTSFTDNGVLTSGTQYYYFIYAANSSSCTGGPIYLTTSPLINSTSLSIAVVPNGQWVVKTSGTTSDLMSVYFPTSNIGYAAGGSGTIVKTTNAGATWTSLTSLGKWLGGIFFTDSITGYAVGNDYSIIKTTNGSTWVTKYQNTTPPAGSTGTNVLYSVYFTDANTGYAVGLYGKILKTTDAGSTWTTLTSGTTIRLNSVCFANSTNGFVAGLSGIFLKTINSGTNWTPISIPTTYNLYSVNFINSTTGLAVGYDNTSASGLILRTTDGGTTWIRQTLSNTIKTLYSVYFTDVNTAYISGTSGVILMSTNGGTTWTTQTSNTTNTLLSIYFPNPYSGYSVGVGGKIVKYQVLPATAGTISGLTTVTTGQSGVVYTVPAIANATSYVWTLPSGTTGTSSTNSITVDYSSSAVSGYITVKGVNSNGNGTASSLAINVIVGKRFDLDSTLSINQIENTKTTKLRIFPNPSSEQTVFSFNIANPDNIKISLFNQQGKLISVIKEEYYQTGEHTFNYNTSILSSGIYFIKFETKKYQIHEKMIIIHK
ncbi:MAG: YCF48-related protein, partial [Bacteroidota bacterium]